MAHTIAAVSTGSQVSAIGILRLSGDDCAQIANKVFITKSGLPLWDAPNRKLTLGSLLDTQGRCIDQCMAVYTRGPHSYTGEDTVEFHCHGSPAVLAAGLHALFHAGARHAKRGEFTMRAFMNGQLNLTEAEAVIDLIEAETADAAANAAGQVGGRLQRTLNPIYNTLTDLCSHFHAVLDYPDEDIDDFKLSDYEETLKNCMTELNALLMTYGQGRILRQGVAATIVGKPNVGKSSLLNALSGYDRVIVTDIPGTTRDTVEECVMVGNTRLRLTDTAGIRQTDDEIEAMGVERSKAAAKNADLILLMCDGSKPLSQEDETAIRACADAQNIIALINKADLPQAITPADIPFQKVIPICAKTGVGLDVLANTIDKMFAGSAPCDGSVLTNPRQYAAIQRSYNSMEATVQGLQLGLTPDAVLTDIELAMEAMGEVTGATVREDITSRIFERFCVGK